MHHSLSLPRTDPGDQEGTSNHAGSLHPKPATAPELGPADVSFWEGRVLSFHQLRPWQQVFRSVPPLQGTPTHIHSPLFWGRGVISWSSVLVTRWRGWIPAAPQAWTAEASPFHCCSPLCTTVVPAGQTGSTCHGLQRLP